MIKVTQAGSYAAQPAAAPAPTGWMTAEALKLINTTTLKPDMALIAQLDSSGPDAWTPPKSGAIEGLVYLSTDEAGLGGFYARDWKIDRVPQMVPSSPDCLVVKNGVADISACANPKAPIWTGLSLFDGYTKKPVASVQFPDLGPSPQAHALGNEAHGIGASGDGKWIYLTGTDSRSTLAGHVAMNIVNARTLKVDKILQTSPHHVTTFKYGWQTGANGAADPYYGKDLVMVSGNGSEIFVLDPGTNAAGYSNTVAKALAPADLSASSTYGHVDNAGKYIFVTVPNQFGAGGGVAVVDLRSMKVVSKIATHDSGPYMVTFSANGNYAYVSNGSTSTIAVIDMSDADVSKWFLWKTETANMSRPYAVVLNWTDNILFSIPKGGGGKSQTVGINSAAALSGGSGLGEVYLNGCIYPDHAIRNPDPALNEMWVSCNNSMENIVVSMGDGKPSNSGNWYSYYVKKFFQDPKTNPNGNVQSPMGGSSHNGAFMAYKVANGVWTGETLSDQVGFHGSAVATYLAATKAAGN
jgi:DNA-binding beta-propeller fold protein YncE